MKPPSNPKSTPTSTPKPKIFDVAKPGQVVPDSTNRPLIVTHRPMVRDPMVTPPAASATTQQAPSPESSPITAPPAKKVTVQPPPATEESVTPNESAGEQSVTAPEPETAVEQSSPVEPTTDQTEQSDKDDQPSAPSDETAENEEKIDDDQFGKAISPSQTASAQKDAQAASRAATENEKLIDSGKYFVHISDDRRKRSLRFAVIGALLIILVSLICLNFLFDAELLDVPGIPHTDLIK